MINLIKKGLKSPCEMIQILTYNTCQMYLISELKLSPNLFNYIKDDILRISELQDAEQDIDIEDETFNEYDYL